MSTPVSAVVVGSTGLVVRPAHLHQLTPLPPTNSFLKGSNILQTLLTHPLTTQITTLSRRQPRAESAKLNAITSDDCGSWSSNLATLKPIPDIFFSGLGTTRAAAGGFENQYKIDHDLNLSLATAAKNAGIKTYVLISSSGADASAYFAYPRMKGELESAVKALGFEHTIILRPGMIVGDRVEYDKRGKPEKVLMGVARMMSNWAGNKTTDFWAQDATVIARAAVNAGLRAAAGQQKESVWTMTQADIVRLGRTEWSEQEVKEQARSESKEDRVAGLGVDKL